MRPSYLQTCGRLSVCRRRRRLLAFGLPRQADLGGGSAARRGEMAGKSKAQRDEPAPLNVAYPLKVELPKRRQAILRRERLITALSDGASRRIAVVTAP